MVEQQETLAGTGGTFNALDHGLWARFVDHMQVNHGAWMRAHAEGGYVGTCRRCGDYLVPEQPYQTTGGLTLYVARCRTLRARQATGVDTPSSGCGFELAAPGGRVLARSSRHSEMPAGWWTHRFKSEAGQ